MPNSYCNLVATDLIKDSYGQITNGFGLVEADYTNMISARNGLNANALINGNFDVWQRGTSFTNSPNAYLADRFMLSYSYDGGVAPSNVINSRQVLTSGDIPNAYYFYRIAPDGAGSSFGVNASYGTFQRIENGTRYLCGLGKKVTVSIWLRSSIAGKRIGVSLSQRYGTGGSPSASEILTGSIVTLTSTWTKYTFTFITNTLVGKTFGTNNDDYLQVGIYEAWGTTTATTNFGGGTAESFVGAGNIDIAQVQLCAGDTALPFQPRSFGEELALCQRYYHKSAGHDDIFTGSATTFMYAAILSALVGIYKFHVPMRINPTVVISQNNIVNQFRQTSNGALLNPTTVTVGTLSKSGIGGITILGASFTVGQMYEFDLTADAEL